MIGDRGTAVPGLLLDDARSTVWTNRALFQNLAENAATGGMPGAYIVIRADAVLDRIMLRAPAAGDLKVFNNLVLLFGDEMDALYTDRARYLPRT